MNITEDERKILNGLRHRGFVIVTFHPEEVGTANPRRVEDRLVELGVEIIEDLS